MAYYTYYSYETDKGIEGLGYIGSRKLKKASIPEQEDYFGTPKSSKNREFKDNPNKDKIILGVFETAEEALEHEIYLHDIWDVDKNPHFANQAKQTSEKFYCSTSWNKGKKLHYKVWNDGKTGLQSHSDEWKKEASDRNKGEKNYFYEGKLFDWINEDLGIIEMQLSVIELREKYDHLKDSKNRLYSVSSGSNKSYRGWKLYKHENQQPE